MKPLRINIVLPFPVTKPVGGPKIMYEYANRLHEKGHTVTVYHSLKRPHKKMKSPLWWKQFIFFMRGAARPKWFPLHKKISSVIVSEITDRYIKDADIIFFTWWQMAYAVKELSAHKGKAVNLVQDYETWNGADDLVNASYRFNMQYVVIAKYLQEIIYKETGIQPELLNNAIDTNRFYIQQPHSTRKPESIIMLYSEEERKGTKYGLQALQELKEEFPGLTVTLFGVFPKPDLPAWMEYHHKPSNLPELYNKNAIFLSPSLGEGWALPPAEAMACGCAVVCTDIGGHAAYAKNNETALLVKPGDVSDIKEKLITLLTDSDKRNSIALNGNAYLLENFSWDKAVGQLEQIFYSLLK